MGLDDEKSLRFGASRTQRTAILAVALSCSISQAHTKAASATTDKAAASAWPLSQRKR
jgi:tryptophanyl-tRNA synthetase